MDTEKYTILAFGFCTFYFKFYLTLFFLFVKKTLNYTLLRCNLTFRMSVNKCQKCLLCRDYYDSNSTSVQNSHQNVK